MAPKIHAQMTVGEALERVPDAFEVLLGFFGGCFLCPNVYRETLDTCAEENHVPIESVMKELRKLAETRRGGKIS